MSSHTIIVYGKKTCPACDAACSFLDSRNLSYTYYDVEHDPQARTAQQALGRTVPQIIINGTHIGGNSDMMNLVKTNKFDELFN